MKMDKTAIIGSAVVGSLGLLSAILGFSAEGTKLIPYTILVLYNECIYPDNPAYGLGISAVIFLLLAQITFSVVGGCCGCCRSRAIPSESKRIIGIICAVFSWLTAVVAWGLLIQGAAWNANVVRMTGPYCYYLKDGIFAGAGVLTLAATALGITSFILLRRPPANAVASTAAPPPPPAAGTPMNKPREQYPPADEMVVGHPVVPSTYAQAQQQPPVAPGSHPQFHGYGQAPPPKPQIPPPPPQASAALAGAFAQVHGSSHSHAPSQAPVPPHATAPAFGVEMAAAQQQISPPQAYGPDDAPEPPQLPIPIQFQVPRAGAQIPAAVPPPTAPPQERYKQAIGVEAAKVGVRLLGKAVEQSLFSDNASSPSAMPGAANILAAMMPDSTGGDVQGADCGGDASYSYGS